MPHRLRQLLASVLALALAGLLSSCMVRSVHSWIKESSATFEEDLLGGWVGGEERADVAMTFVRGNNGGYVMQYSSKDGQGTFVGRIAKIGGDFFVDFSPKEGAPGVDGMLLYRMHSLAKLELRGDRLTVRPLDYDQVKAAAQLDRLSGLKYAWDDEKDLVITSPTEDLEAFIHTLGRDSNLLAPPIRLTRTK